MVSLYDNTGSLCSWNGYTSAWILVKFNDLIVKRDKGKTSSTEEIIKYILII